MISECIVTSVHLRGERGCLHQKLDLYVCKPLYLRQALLMIKQSPLGAEMQASSKVLPSQRVKVSRGEIHVIKERCKQCNLCIDFCPTQVLTESDEVNEKGYHIPELVEEPEKGNTCVACGFCEVICPEYAIWVEERRDK